MIKKKMAHRKWLCCHCLKSGKGGGTCGKHGHLIVGVSHKLYFPKITASKRKWIKMLFEDSWAGKNLAARSTEKENYIGVLLKTLDKK